MPYANPAPLRRVRVTLSEQLLTDATRLANALSSAARAMRIADALQHSVEEIAA